MVYFFNSTYTRVDLYASIYGKCFKIKLYKLKSYKLWLKLPMVQKINIYRFLKTTENNR